MAQPTQAAIDMLRKSPETAPQFEEVFGKGSSAQYVQPAKSGILNTIGSVASDIGNGIAETPRAVARGAINAVNETSNAAKSVADGIQDFSASHGVDLGHIVIDHHGIGWEPGKAEGNDLQVPKAVTPDEPQSTTGHLIEGVSQFTAGMIGAGKFLKTFGVGGAVSGLGKFAEMSGKAALADATVFDPHAERLSNLVQANPSLQNPVTDFLASKADDSEAMGRFKNALEGFMSGAAIESFMHGVKAIKLARNGDLKGAAYAAEEAGVKHTEANPTTPPDGPAGATAPAHEFPEGDSRNEPAAVNVTPEAPPTPNERSAQEQAKPGEQVVEGEAKPAEPSAEASPTTDDTIPDAVPTEGVDAPTGQRDVMNVGAKSLPFRLSDEELDQYGKNLDSRFSVAGQEMANTGQHFNFSKINTTDDIKAAINSMANVADGRISELAKGDNGNVRSWDAVKQHANTIANIVGGDPRLMVQHLTTLSENVSHLDSMMKASGDMLVTLSSHSDKLAQMVADETPGEYKDMKTLLGAYNHSTQLLANTYSLLKNVQTNVARAQNAGKIVRGVNPVFKQGIEAVGPEDEWMLKVLAKRQAAAARGADGEIDAAASTRKLLEGSLFDRALAVHNEFWFNSVLSGVKTHVVNTTVNTAKAIFMPAEQMVAGIISRNTPQFLEGAYQYAGMAESLKSSLKMAAKAFQVQDNVLDYRGAYEGVHKQAITAAMFGQEDNASLAPLINGLGTVVRIPSRLLMAEDEFFKQITYRSRIYASAMREGVEKGLDATGVGELVAKRLDEAFDPNGHANLVDHAGIPVQSRVDALDQSRMATFTQPLGEGTIGRWIESGAQAHPFIRVLMPFVRVPTNIIRDVWQHTPMLGLVQKQMREDIAAGGERASLAYAKQATGAALWGAATAYALEGKITGYGPVDPQQRSAWLMDNQPYSFVSTDPQTGKKTFTSFNRLDPYGVPLGLVADFAHIAGQLSDGDRDEFAKGAVLALVNNLASKTYLQGLIQAVNIMSDNPQAKLNAYLEQRAASYIPNAFGVANPDPHLREVRGMLDAMAAKVPGFSQTLPPRRDVMGEPLNIPMGWPFSAVNPFTVKATDNDPAKAEMARLSASDAGIRFPMPSSKMDGLDLTQVKDTDGVSAYDKWMQNIGELTLGGRTLHEKLNETVQSSAYQNAADGNQTFKKSRKVDLIMRDMERYRDRALHETLKDYPDLKQALRDYKTGSKRVRAGQTPSSDPFAVFNQ